MQDVKPDRVQRSRMLCDDMIICYLCISWQAGQGGGHRTLLYGHAILLRHSFSGMVSISNAITILKKKSQRNSVYNWTKHQLFDSQIHYWSHLFIRPLNKSWFPLSACLNVSFHLTPIHFSLTSTWPVWKHQGLRQTSCHLMSDYKKIQ